MTRIYNSAVDWTGHGFQVIPCSPNLVRFIKGLETGGTVHVKASAARRTD